jgi:hypothetical protein
MPKITKQKASACMEILLMVEVEWKGPRNTILGLLLGNYSVNIPW